VPRLCPEASHSRKNILVKFGIANIGVVHMGSFKVEMDYFVASFQIKKFFLSIEFKGDTIFHNFSQNSCNTCNS
jgi:hypothetical protein